MPNGPTRYTARWVLPVTAPPIADGALLVSADGHIRAVGPAASIPLRPGTTDIALGEAALLPGLVNTHAHPELTAFRGLLEDLPFPDWIGRLMQLKRAAALPLDAYRTCARWGCLEAIAAGVTMIAATEDSGASFDVMRELGLRGIVYYEVFGPAPDQADVATDELRRVVTAARARETDLVRVGVSPHAPYTVSDPLFMRVAELAHSEAMPVAVHAAESRAEDLLVRMGAGPFARRLHARGIDTPVRATSTIALLDRTGILAAQPLLIHCVRVDANDIGRIAHAGASVAHCPIANARLGHGTAPLHELLEASIAVGLGTDSVAANNRVDLLEEARAAQLLHRAVRQAPVELPADRLLRLATIDGARALGLDDRIGSLEIGKEADLCAVSLGAPHTSPVYDPADAVLHAARGTDIVMTAVRGRILYRNGAWTGVDIGAARAAVEDVADRLRSASRQP